MKYIEAEIAKKIKDEIISLYEGLIETIWEKLIEQVGEKKGGEIFDEAAKGSNLFFIKDGQINLRGFLINKEKEEIVAVCNNFITSFLVVIGKKR